LERVFSIRDEVLKALEEARNAKQIGSSLEAKSSYFTDGRRDDSFLLDYFEQLRYIFIVSQVEVHEAMRRKSRSKMQMARSASAAGTIRFASANLKSFHGLRKMR
jgi:isoleucyl-tRNA synthetase